MARAKKSQNSELDAQAITEIIVGGFKSITDKQSIEIRPLTILAGANSSGKSSMMQPLLLLKQTLEASYDPGPLLLNGPNVKFTSAEQLLSRIGKHKSSDIFMVGIHLRSGDSYHISYRKEHKMGFQIDQMEISGTLGKYILWPDMTSVEIAKTGITKGKENLQQSPDGYGKGHWEIKGERCILELSWLAKGIGSESFRATEPTGALYQGIIPKIIHLPGLRGSPERTYPKSGVGPAFPGTFEKYFATLILHWINKWMFSADQKIETLIKDLELLELGSGVLAKSINDVQIELQIGRLPDVPPEGPEDMVNIADVGVGVSQTLPILVALHAAEPNRLVYVEQPEAHLHPRAQFALAQIFASAIKRGVRVVLETHSSLLLLGIQTLVAEGELDPDKIKLHWFQRETDGRTKVRSSDLDEAGRFGEWPEDFDDVTLGAQKKYLDAADKRLFAK